MLSVSEQIGQVVAADTRLSVESMNSAVIAQARMCATVVEAASAAKLPIGVIQNVLNHLSEGIRDVVASRAGLALAIRELSSIKSNSNLGDTDFGCPTGCHTNPPLDVRVADTVMN